MRHAREDYNRIQDPQNKIPLLEPVFLLRGQDKHAARVVRFWADLLDEEDADHEIIQKARDHADLIDSWPDKKQPDLPRET